MENKLNKISELKEKYEILKRKLNSKREPDGKIPLKEQFIGTIEDFNIITKALETLSDEEIVQHYSLEEIEHLIQTIDEYNNPIVKPSKVDFSMHTIIAINDLLNGNEKDYKELLEVLYMTIFQRYNDDINKSKNYKVTPEFLNIVYRFEDEGKNFQSIETSEKDVGAIFMTHNEYRKLVNLWENEYSTNEERRTVYKEEIVNYVLSNIRNRMMHGDFENRTDNQGNKIVQISPYGFKAKFFFDCIVEFYEAVSNAIKTGEQVQDNDLLFDFEQVFLKKEDADTSILDDKDKIMTLALPLYINGFITYNCRNKNEFEKLQKAFAKQGQTSTSKGNFLNQYYKKNDENSFIYQIADYYKKHKEEYYSSHQDIKPVQEEYTAHDIFEHLRNSIVHNNFKCEKGMVHIRDFDENYVETANFFFPYEMFENLIEEQARHAKQYFEPVGPEESDSKSGTSINVDEEREN